MTGSRSRPAATVALSGVGWGRWRGAWTSRRTLEGGGEGWRLLEGGRELERWPRFDAAVAGLWSSRRARDDAPWAIGWLGYEACAELAGGLPAHPAEPGLPRGAWLLEPWQVDPGEAALDPGVAGADAGRSASLDDRAFRDGVNALRAHIRSGAVYQVNLTRRFTVTGWRGGLGGLELVAREGGTPDYLAAYRLGGGELLCASMELLLRRRGTVLETCPIKGTRRRGGSAAEDRRLAAELAADPKEAAELAMVVDLERNDLGRLAQVGSVEVVDPGRVCSYSAVHHRVARVRARAPVGLEWWRLLAAMAPGGSVTGCPKIAAMELIRDLETVPRGPYTGVLGVVAGNGDLEIALPIRSAWQWHDRMSFAAGCGIVWDSKPAAEVEESSLKVARWLGVTGWRAP